MATALRPRIHLPLPGRATFTLVPCSPLLLLRWGLSLLGWLLVYPLAWGAPLPFRLVLVDCSSDKYYGQHGARYELVATTGHYQLYQTAAWHGTDTLLASKRLHVVPAAAVDQLLQELAHPRSTLTPADLHVRYATFRKARLLRYCRPYRLSWTRAQIQFTRQQLAQPQNIDHALRRYVLRQGYARLHSSGSRTFSFTLVYPTHRLTLTASAHPYGIPWRDEQGTAYYNAGIAPCLLPLLPDVPSANRTAFAPQNLVPGLVEQLYFDRCARALDQLTWQAYPAAFKALRERYRIPVISEQTRSYDWQWDGERRLYFQAKDSTMLPGVYLGATLTLAHKQLFTPDSLLRLAPYYIAQLQRVPFLVQFLAADTARRAVVSFNNTHSLSQKQKADQQAPDACLPGATESYLNRCVTFRLTEENGRNSVWLITPQLDVVLLYYFGQGVYRYSDAELGADRHHVCKHFNLDGSLKP